MQKVKKDIVSYTKPSITELEIDFVTDAIKNGWGENCYHYINKFEEDSLKIQDEIDAKKMIYKDLKTRF